MLRRKPIDAGQLDLQEKVVEVRRVTKVVKVVEISDLQH